MEQIASRLRTNAPTPPEQAPLKGKVAIVTGSNSGIGAAVVRELAIRGASVVINYPQAAVKEQADQVGSSLGGADWIGVEADISTIEGPKHLVTKTVEKYGKVDILVNNAGVAILPPIEETTVEQWDQSLNTNARGAFLVTQAVLPHLPPKSQGGGGRVIFITSEVVTSPQPGQVVYTASKAALAAMARALAKDLPGPYGCTVNAVSPGIVKTPTLMRELTTHPDPFLTTVFDKITPIDGWIGLPEDVAFAVAFLAESRASWINGASINVSGGMFVS